MLVHFKGGPLGGETQKMDRPMFYGRRLAVPAPHRITYISEADTYPPLRPMYDIEYYELDYPIGPDEYNARWINPAESLIEENTRLKYQLRKKEQDDAALQALETLRNYFR